MSTLSRRGPFAKQPAKLPAIEAIRVEDPQAQRAINALKEWVEVRLGARGDPFERAVTLRDMTQRLDALKAELVALIPADTITTTETAAATAPSANLGPLSAAVAEVAARLDAMATRVTTLEQQEAAQAEETSPFDLGLPAITPPA